jgi:predicted Ser/Thr protein kinase
MESSGTRIGSEIGGFRIESVLGRGGMSVVYLAEQTRLGRKVALKVLASGLGDDGQFRDRFLQESHLAASLDHPNVIPIYDAGEDEGCLYIAMRYVEGRDLGEVLKSEGALGLGRTLFIIDQVAGALDAAHEHGLVHRDVKPANVLLVGASDRVYLTDFGVAKPTTSAGLTRTGFFIGTPDYSAPEQIEGREVGERVDVYALGGVLYSCLTGQVPFQRDTEVAVLQAHLMEPPPKLKDLRPDLPRGLDRVIAKAMAKSKDDRFETCGELAAAAQAAAHERPTAPAVGLTVAASYAPETGETELSAPAVAADAAGVTAAATEGSATQASPPSALASTDLTAAGAVPSEPPRRPPAAHKRRWMLAGAGAALLVVGGLAVALVLALGGSSAKQATAGTSNGKMTTLQQAVVTANQTEMAKGMFPISSCDDRMLQGGVEQLNCPNVWKDVSAVVYRYPTLTALYERYHHDLSAFRLIDGTRLAANSSNCIGSGATGESAWRHPPYPVQNHTLDPTMPASMAKKGWEGRVFCGESSSQPFQFEWTYDPGLLLGVATSLNHDDVWTWWHATHHNLLIGSMSMAMGTTGPTGQTGMGDGAMGTSYHVMLSGDMSMQAGSSMPKPGTGTADVTITGTKICWTFKLTGVDQPTVAHIHQGKSNQSGAVVVPLGGTYKPAGCTTASSKTAKAILANPSGYYANVHTVKYPDGAVRGQL